MRAVVAKRLRAEARDATIGKPERKMIVGPFGTLVNSTQAFRGDYLQRKIAYRRSRG